MNHSGSTKRPQGRSQVPHGSCLTIPQHISALLSKINSTDARTYIAEASSSLSSVVAEIEQLQTKLTHVATMLKIHRNSTRPINMLPHEMLVKIFHEVYPRPTNFPPTVYDYPRADSLVKITHVCSHWRQTALTCSSLWSTIHVSGWRSQHITTFLQRSMSSPLRIFVSSGEPNKHTDYLLSDAIWALGAHSRRFIECHIPHDACSSDAQLFMELPSPSLEVFSSQVAGPLATLPSPTPHLRKLAYSLEQFDQFAPHCKNLTHLSLHAIYPNVPTTKSILEALRHTPLLEVFAIGLPNITETEIDAMPQPVVLDHLRELEIGGYSTPQATSMIASFVDLLIIPSSAETCIWLKQSYYGQILTIYGILSAMKAGSRFSSNLAQITQIDVSPCMTAAAISTKGSRMILAPMSDVPSKWFPLPSWFQGQVKEIVLWGATWTIDASSIDHYVTFFHKIPHIDTLTLCGIDLNMVRQAAEIACNKENSVQESLPDTRPTTDEQPDGSQMNVPQIRSLSRSSEARPWIFPTTLSEWM